MIHSPKCSQHLGLVHYTARIWNSIQSLHKWQGPKYLRYYLPLRDRRLESWHSWGDSNSDTPLWDLGLQWHFNPWAKCHIECTLIQNPRETEAGCLCKVTVLWKAHLRKNILKCDCIFGNLTFRKRIIKTNKILGGVIRRFSF